MFQIVFVLLLLAGNVHFDWQANGMALGIVGSIGAIYLSAILIALRGYFGTVLSKVRKAPQNLPSAD